MVQQRTVAVFGGLKLRKELRIHLHVIGVDANADRYLFGVVLVVGNAVMLLGDANLGISALTDFARHHESEYARDIRLPGGGDKIEHQTHMLVEQLGNADRSVESGLALVVLGTLDAALDLADIVEIIAEARAVALTEAALEVAGLFGNRIENAALLADGCQSFTGSAGFAEDAFEGGARIGLHGKRRGGRAPRDGVHVGAAEAWRAAADVAGEILSGEFNGRKRGILADAFGHNLIDGGV